MTIVMISNAMSTTQASDKLMKNWWMEKDCMMQRREREIICTMVVWMNCLRELEDAKGSCPGIYSKETKSSFFSSLFFFFFDLYFGLFYLQIMYTRSIVYLFVVTVLRSKLQVEHIYHYYYLATNIK